MTTQVRLWAALAGALSLLHPAQASRAEPASKPAAAPAAGPTQPLPPESITQHRIVVDGRPLEFRARAGAVPLVDAAKGTPQAEVAFVSFELAGADPARRPIVFAFNGGPGAGSAWLALGGLGPWRIRMDGDALSPSAPPAPIENQESWLPFADLVFVDPPGAGYSRISSADQEVRKSFHSVDGDIDALAVVVRKWLATHDRLASPKFIAGESYGGFRAPRLAQRLAEHENIGVRGLLLISPALDIGYIEGRSPLALAARLPSFAAVARGGVDRSGLADVEAYAASEFIVDLVKGPADAAALARLTQRVSDYTGLEPALVRQANGRIDVGAFVRARGRDRKSVLSSYDGMIAGLDPDPSRPIGDYPDAMLDTLRAPLATAMSSLVTGPLAWPVRELRYEILNDAVAGRWDWGRGGRREAESAGALRRILALDPRLRILVVHGSTDLATPYFATKLMLDQLPVAGAAERIRFVVTPGGHMLYAHDKSRATLRDEARKTIEATAER